MNSLVYFAVGVAALGGLLVGYDTGVISGAILFIKDQFSLSAAMEAAVGAMLLGTHTAAAPWLIARTDSKRHARLNLMRDVLSLLHRAGKREALVQPDRDIVFEFTPDCVATQRLAR